MRSLVSLAIVSAFLIPALASAQSAFETVALPIMKQAVATSFAASETNTNCAVGGTVAYDKLALGKGGATSSATVISSLINSIEGNRQHLLQDGSKCGSCQQVNQVAAYTTSEPEKILRNEMCDKMPTVNVQKLVADSDLKTFAAGTLRGSTPEGKKLYASCPNPCSFHVASATTPMGNQQSLINLTVHCGQPRAGSILFAKYKFSSGLIHKWTCR